MTFIPSSTSLPLSVKRVFWSETRDRRSEPECGAGHHQDEAEAGAQAERERDAEARIMYVSRTRVRVTLAREKAHECDRQCVTLASDQTGL